jgi:hypothetical protein
MLQRLSSVTHSSDPNQRAVDVPVTATKTWGRITVKIEANPAILPPGFYQLSFRDWRNIPSKSTIIRVYGDSIRTTGGSAPAAAPAPCCCDCGPSCC